MEQTKTKKVFAAFDIGKTNKKLFVFDIKFNLVKEIITTFKEIEDDDGYPCEDLLTIVNWCKEQVQLLFSNPAFELIALNFSTYGASLVNIDDNGALVTPFYNYTKKINPEIIEEFYHRYGNQKFINATGSPRTDNLLNSGLQLYWLKRTKPHFFKKIKWSLHLPQYFSYVFTGIPVTEYTSLGCHTLLWNIDKRKYHDWVVSEGLEALFPTRVNTNHFIDIDFDNKQVAVGPGIHDSSASLLPYFLGYPKDFILLSTGTWSITLNPFYEIQKSIKVGQTVLKYLTIEGNPVVATRFFMGIEYRKQVLALDTIFQKPEGYHRTITYNPKIAKKLSDNELYFNFQNIVLERKKIAINDLKVLGSYEAAYHQLVFELVQLQIRTINLADPTNKCKRLFIDGGFSKNQIYIQLLLRAFPKKSIRITNNPYGAALGACIVKNAKNIKVKFLKKHYKPTKPKLIEEPTT